MKRIPTLVLSLVVGLAGLPLIATAAGDHGGSHSGHGSAKAQATTTPSAPSSAAVSSGSEESTEGEIKKIDKDAGKVTIKHAELKNLDMPAMTMVFQVKDKAMLDQLKTGDKVKFVAEKVNGKFTVTQLQTKN